jgi:hypothetical protein
VGLVGWWEGWRDGGMEGENFEAWLLIIPSPISSESDSGTYDVVRACACAYLHLHCIDSTPFL